MTEGRYALDEATFTTVSDRFWSLSTDHREQSVARTQ
jgi:hypothetical protein